MARARFDRPVGRILYHARPFMIGVGGLAILATGIAVTRGQLATGAYAAFAPLVAAAAAGVLLITSWLGWIDLVSALSLRIDDRSVTLGYPTPRIIALRDVTSLTRSIGSMRLLLRTKTGDERLQLTVETAPPASLSRLVKGVQAGGGKVEEYLVKLAEYLEDAPDPE